MFGELIARFTERRALNAFTLGDYAKAERLFTALRRREGDTQRVLRNLGLTRMAQGDLDGAEACFLREVEAFGATPDRLKALAEVAYLSGDRDKAARRIREALEAQPGPKGSKGSAGAPGSEGPAQGLLARRAEICADPAVHARAMAGKKDFARGNERLAAGDEAEALAAFRRAVQADPTDFAALNNIGGLLLNRLDDPEGAIQAFTRAMELADMPMLRINLARARAKLSERKG
jgi:tetratricopeptide (TPR) repeat protein